MTASRSGTVRASARDKNHRAIVAYRLVAAQLALASALAGLLLAMWGPPAARSALVGGLIAAAPNLLLAQRVLRLAENTPPEAMLKAFYIGGALKITTSGALFVIAFALLEVRGGIVIGAFAAAVMIQWLALLFPDSLT